jgi:uncharacterized membrane protein YdbT with pleckstrin-like domain
MIANREYVVRALKQIDIFSELNDDQIGEIASKFSVLELEPSQHLFSDREPQEDFYIVIKGKLFVSDGGEQGEKKTQLAGDYFNEEELLYGQIEDAYITTDEPSEVFHLNGRDFSQLKLDYPVIKPWFARNPESQWLVRKRKFKWIGEDELVAFVARKHEVIFVFSLIGPLIFFLAALAIIFAVSFTDVSSTIWTSGAICSLGLAFLAVLWGLWNWIDWGNDYYIVTDQRVVWVEKVIWLYESRDEAPLTTILAVNTATTFLGRLLDYGSVIIKTFTGEITFRKLRDPQQMVAYIDEYRTRVQRGAERKEKWKIDQEIRERLGLDVDEYPETAVEEQPVEIPAGEQEEKQSVSSGFFKNFFTMRFEHDGVITYRKYWPTLFGKIWLPTLLIFFVLLAMIILVSSFQSNWISAQTAQILFVLSIAFILFVLIPWWIYRYVDWRNDIYQVSDKNIIDMERRPLGTEVKKSAPVENILSLEHERVGFMGYMFNYGQVTINVGDTQFVFRNVHDPARVQQDIFNRMYSLRRQKEKVEAAQQRQRFVDVIEVYHQNIEDQDEDDYFDDYDDYEDDFGVELGSDGYP